MDDLTAGTAPAAPEVLVEQRGRLGVLTLNRPKAINALTHGMVREIGRMLDAWEGDAAVQAVLITGAGDRGLCAGGDLVALYRDALDGDGTASAVFWADEYRMNARLARYPKPVVAIQDGLVLGGGIGVSAHCSHRVVTERSRLGLPEVGIGFVPDVGGTWLLSRAPGQLGVAAALSGRMIGAADAIALGLSDAFVPSDRLDGLLSALEVDEPTAAIAAVAGAAPAGELVAGSAWIDAVFAGDDAAAIVERLAAAGEPAAKLAAAVGAASPVAVSVALAALRRARALPTLEAALVQEFRVSMHALSTSDFSEGVRAQVIDKDRQPRWQPASLAEVTQESVDAYFAEPEAGDLDLVAEEQQR
ncbi:3-hydroxyisobutyryl-CoA hydrolase [Agrococcus sp. ARC_14]|uniref:3-hydroxyisobutyryl-CoA hydrolase n=1 Tax=Agrococcus sp. ARC_14 TaxID=2919927 RepID=UPI001F05FD8F|nr:3-hydroxyisobutyryl-CoA hydrolase [Agrococcus sp. ARC_14]MCH1884230.1 3-hydroxyisobutyryl-CoA hydrolase [Agrococcus sp. ARC_14]